jgi:hypothetical protein
MPCQPGSESDGPELRRAIGRFAQQPLRFVEAPERCQEEIASRKNASPFELRVLVEPAQAFLHRRRTLVLGGDELDLGPAHH